MLASDISREVGAEESGYEEGPLAASASMYSLSAVSNRCRASVTDSSAIFHAAKALESPEKRFSASASIAAAISILIRARSRFTRSSSIPATQRIVVLRRFCVKGLHGAGRREFANLDDALRYANGEDDSYFAESTLPARRSYWPWERPPSLTSLSNLVRGAHRRWDGDQTNLKTRDDRMPEPPPLECERAEIISVL